MEISVFWLSSLLYILLFSFLLAKKPEWFLEERKEQCFLAFFIAGVLAIALYRGVATFK